jgi:hypothetical protein
MERDDLLTFRIPRDLKIALKMAAESDERSMSRLAVRILRQWLTSHGFFTSHENKAKKRHSTRS